MGTPNVPLVAMDNYLSTPEGGVATLPYPIETVYFWCQINWRFEH